MTSQHSSRDIKAPQAVKEFPAATATARISKLGAIRLDSRALIQKEGRGKTETAVEIDDHGHKQLVKELQVIANAGSTFLCIFMSRNIQNKIKTKQCVPIAHVISLRI